MLHYFTPSNSFNDGVNLCRRDDSLAVKTIYLATLSQLFGICCMRFFISFKFSLETYSNDKREFYNANFVCAYCRYYYFNEIVETKHNKNCIFVSELFRMFLFQ